MTNEPRSPHKKLLYTVAVVFVLFLIAGVMRLTANRADNDDYRDDAPIQVSGKATQTTPADSASPTSGTSPAVETSTFSAADVAQHANASSCYVNVGGNVYDLTSWIAQHPGGSEAILGLCGTNGTDAFARQHGSNAKAQAALASFMIGTLR